MSGIKKYAFPLIKWVLLAFLTLVLLFFSSNMIIMHQEQIYGIGEWLRTREIGMLYIRVFGYIVISIVAPRFILAKIMNVDRRKEIIKQFTLVLALLFLFVELFVIQNLLFQSR